jgi:putative phosphoribosyl transferase
MMPFSNRTEAGRKLAEVLAFYKEQHPVILALPRGGAPVAAEIATALEAPLDLVLVRKIGVPFQPELAMGAVIDGQEPLVVRNEQVIRMAEIKQSEFDAIRDRELEEIERRRKLYLGNRPHSKLKGQTVIIVDDGIATGATIRVALRAICMRKPRKLILAVPVAPTQSLDELRTEADEIVCLEDYDDFGAIGLYYSDFRQISDAEVIKLLAQHPVNADLGAH